MSQHGIFCKASFCLPRLTLHLGKHLLRTTLGTSMTIDDWDDILCHLLSCWDIFPAYVRIIVHFAWNCHELPGEWWCFFEKCKLDCFRCWKWWCFEKDLHVRTVKLTFFYYFLFHLIPTLCHRVTYCIILWHILQRIVLLA